jgi:predicted alpha/beta-fold hydrolase
VELPPYTRERILTADDDFLDLDWIRTGSQKLLIISHGLEGNSYRPYVKGMAKAGLSYGFDILAWNYRGCSEEMNRQLRFYHSGATDDLGFVIQHAIRSGYHQIYLVGFSLGGNLTLKYLGEQKPPVEVKRAVAFSVPLNLYTSCLTISKRSNTLYAYRFLRSLKKKVMEKSRSRTEIDVKGIERIDTLLDFDDRYTAPLHGFAGARDYYDRCSAIGFLPSIQTPTLLISAANDPFLSEECFPHAMLKDHAHVQFENPRRGGHVGFAQFNKNGLYWSDERAMDFFNEIPVR